MLSQIRRDHMWPNMPIHGLIWPIFVSQLCMDLKNILIWPHIGIYCHIYLCIGTHNNMNIMITYELIKFYNMAIHGCR